MKKTDTITIEVLDDAIIKVTSADAISAANHTSAEALVQGISTDAGGKTKVTKLGKTGRVHTHADGTTHAHD